jgi:histone-lysine N-methyltransferase EZH2
MSSIHMPCDKKSTAEGFPDMSQETFVKNKPKDTTTRSVFAVPTTKYKSNAVKVPPFKEYVGLRNSVLADNESKLLATPYLEDQGDDFTDALAKYYEMTHDENGPLDLRKEQCRFYKDGIEAFLAEVGVSWNDVLYWLLAPNQMIRRINDTLSGGDSFEATLLERSQFEGEEFMRDIQREVVLFDRNSKHSRDLFNQLEEPTASTLRLSAIACVAVLEECEFGIWYLARQSEIMHTHILRKTEQGRTAPKSTYRQAMCRVCHQYVYAL